MTQSSHAVAAFDLGAALRQEGLTETDYSEIQRRLGRDPNRAELGMFGVMWSEHCCYRNSRPLLSGFPTEGPRILVGPGENAGVVDLGEGHRLAFKIESHNHPSAVEPFQGAATGVGGILRDIFTMGARPIALLNALRFGPLEEPATRGLVEGVVAGIAHYGNCVGVPTVGGEVAFDPSYQGNPLVNAMALGLMETDDIVRSGAAGVGNPVVYVGSTTGRDGMGGASFASAELSADSLDDRPAVQVGDPFLEKGLIEACLEAFQSGDVVAAQDMGAAGLTSSSIEMASKGNLGIEINLNKVPCREANMTPYEIMLSESQERMLIVLENGKEEKAKKIFDKWNLDFAVIGKTTNSKKIELFFDNEQVADIPVNTLVENSPMYDRKWKKAKLPKKNKIKKEDLKNLKIIDVLKKVLSHPNVCSKEWIWQQYDHTVMGDTIQKPGGDSGVVRVHGTDKAVAASVDSSAVYCWAHPLTGGKQVVCESFRNLISVGAKPVAITNCLNFGSPENEENMGEFVECVQGIGEAAGYLKFPVVSGNVSFYNQTKDEGIKPTPSIGGVGLIKDYKKMITMDFKQVDNIVLVIGKTEGHIDQSLLARNILNEKNGPPPEVNLFNEKNNGETVLKLIDAGHIKSAHDVSIGGIITAISKMCIKGNKGINLKKPKYLINEIEYYFGEDQGRYIIEVSKDSLKKVTDILNKNAVHYDELGTINEDQLFINEKTKVSIDELTTSNTNWLTNYMSK